jgi:hypothetical protein
LLGGYEGLEIMSLQNNNYTKIAELSSHNSFALPATTQNILTGWLQIWLSIFGNCLQDWGLRIREIALLLIIPFALLGYLFFSSKKNNEFKRKIISLLILVFTQTLFATLLAIKSGHIISFQTTYTNFVIPYAMILIGCGLFDYYQINKYQSIILGFTIICIMIISLIPCYSNRNKHYPVVNQHYLFAKEVQLKYKRGNEILIKFPYDAKMINLYLDDDVMYPQKIDTTLKTKFLIQ